MGEQDDKKVYGYVLISSTDQNEDRQMIEMKKDGVCREVAIDKQSEKIMMDRHIFVKVNA